MRQQSAHLWRYIGRLTLMTALLLFGVGAAHAQLPVFDGLDWVTDRGSITDVPITSGLPAGGDNADAFRPGYTPQYLTTFPVGGPPDAFVLPGSLLNNNPGPGVRRWVFPRTSDLTVTTGAGANTIVTVDNATRSALGQIYAVPPAPFADDQNEPIGDYSQDTLANRTRVSPFPPAPAVQGAYDPQQMAHMFYVPNGVVNWILPDSIPGDPGIANGGVSPVPDYRSPNGGFSLNTDPSLPWDLDYAFTPAVHDDFNVPDINGGNPIPATDAQIAQLPYGDQAVVAAINNELNTTNQVKAYYTSGAYNLSSGNYAVQVFVPGDGTITSDGTVHPSTSRVMVRVSWGTSGAVPAVPGTNTVNADGTLNFATVNNLTNSRIFVLNQEGGGGWVTLAAPGQVQAGIPYDGAPADQIVVTLYTLTPDDTNPNASDNNYAATPLVTADAVQFVPVISNTSSPGLGPISANGRILGPAVATNKLTNAVNTNIQTTEVLPFIYFGREETLPDQTLLVPENPNEPVDLNPTDPGYNPLIPDPTATKTVPVFYCIDNQDGDVMNGGVFIDSKSRLRWRYMGLPDPNDLLIDSSDTTLGSPLIANVRCRDGVVRTMVYFTSTSPDLTAGRVYAFDAVGDRTTMTTTAYWVYPSYRPIDAADAPNDLNNELAGVYYEYHDPNYKNWTALGVSYFNPLAAGYWNPGDYPVTSFGKAAVPDQKIGVDEYYDGEITTNPGQVNGYVVDQNNTQIGGMGGIFAGMLLIDDPANPTGPQLLIVPSTNGRIYTFDAGGRGDYNPNNVAAPLVPVPGTTQRMWTYPHFGADGWHFLGKSTSASAVNYLQDELGVGTSLSGPPLGGFLNTPAYDPNYVINNPAGDPFFIGGTDGYLRAILPIRDDIGLPNVLGSQLPNWNNAKRLAWTYPALGAYPLTANGDPNTPSDISPVTIFSNSLGTKSVLFTAVGRVYDLPELTGSTANTPTWIFPFTNNPPFVSDPNDVFPYDFAAMPPLAVTQANLPGSTQDEVYALDSSSNLYMLDPGGNGAGGTVLQATGQSISGSYTISPPILSLLQADDFYTSNGVLGTSQPTIIFADSDGNAWGLNAIPPMTSPGVLPVAWSHSDSLLRRDAPFILVNGMLIEGGEDGQLRGYGVGAGPNEDLDTVGPGEPAERTPGIDQLSIDIRTLNLYDKSDWTAMMQGPTYSGTWKTALETGTNQTGTPLNNTAQPSKNNVNNTLFGVDWGDYMYVVASGVYHAQPVQPGTTVYGTAAPKIAVTFTVSVPGQPAVTYPVSGALVLPGYVGGALAGEDPNLPTTYIGWPDDLGVTATEHNNLKIYGMDQDGNTNEQTGPSQQVFPWIAKIRIPISPGGRISFTPGTIGYKVTANATITQNIIDGGTPVLPATANSYTLGLGQSYWQGYDVAPAIPGGPVPSPNASLLPAGRQVGVTNPIGLTVRSYTGNGGVDMTGPTKTNIIGWSGSINNSPVGPGELLGNGNRQSIPGVLAGGGATVFKGIYAPIGMVPDGSGATYHAINDNTRQPVNALFAVDRSALGRMAGTKSFQVQVVTSPVHWFGGPSSVMNPLPWELLPTNFTESKDYTSIGENALSVKTGSGQDAVHQLVTLTPPIYHDTNPIQNPAPGDPIQTRLNVPTPLIMSVTVPKYQPANVNRGLTTGTLPNGNTFTFGQGFTGIDGKIVGSNLQVNNNPVIGPMQTIAGQPVNPGDPLAFPAAGYTAQLDVEAIVPGSTATATATGVAALGGAGINRTSVLQRRATNGAAGSTEDAYRSFDTGLTVPPNIRMSVQETTVDLGKEPHGTGYSPSPSPGTFILPFSPTGSSDNLLSLTGPTLPLPNPPLPENKSAPWDDPFSTTLGQFFRTFHLTSDSNINLVNIRPAKLQGLPGVIPGPVSHSAVPVPGATTALRLGSDQVNNLDVAPLFASPFFVATNGLGNIGIVTSFDHISLIANPSVTNNDYREHPLWPLPNPYVFGQDVTAVGAVNGSLILTDALNLGVVGWKDQIQPQPTIGKPRVGDATGHTATIPDKPHDAPDIPIAMLDPTGLLTDGAGNFFRAASFFTSPEIGVAIPIGTPVGTYSNPVNFYEDNTPPQWREWLASSGGFVFGKDNDAVIDLSASGSPLEIHTDPTLTLKVTVRESRLTEGTTAGSLAAIDNLLTGNIFPGPGGTPIPVLEYAGANSMPAPWLAPGNAAAKLDPRTMWLFWSTNRIPGSPSTATAGTPWNLAVSAMPMPYTVNVAGVSPPFAGDANFANPQANALLSSWWAPPNLFTNGYSPAKLFPSTPAEQAAASNGAFTPSLLAGNRQLPQMYSPAVASSLNIAAKGYGQAANVSDQEAYLFWQGQVDKQSFVGAGGAIAVRDMRTFFEPLSALAGPNGNVFSLMNDPALTKLSPKPLLVKLPPPVGGGAPAQKFLYLFWHAGNNSSSSIYYNVAATPNLNGIFDPTANNIWSTDTKLPLPGSLVSESDPYPVYRHINGIDAIDVVFTGVLNSRQKVEILLARYAINRIAANGPVGALTLMPLPTVVQETMTRVGTTNTFAARDAFWGLGTGANGTIKPTDINGQIEIDYQQNSIGSLYHLNEKYILAGGVATPDPAKNMQVGTFDPASGLVTYNSLAIDGANTPQPGVFGGGQMVVDVRSGTVSFPQGAPTIRDTVLVSYTPYVMRLNTNRDQTNAIQTQIPNAWVNDRAFAPKPAANSPGSNAVPVAIMDRTLNLRANLFAPNVVFNAGGGAPELDRLWVFYRKSDPSGAVKSTIYYKAMRLMIKLPRPVALTPPDANNQQQIASLTVTGVNGPYEVDWVRGRVYFTEVDEGNPNITVTYQYFDSTTNTGGTATNLPYTVAWGDEMSAASSTGDETVPETPLPTDQAVNESQVAAFKDPYLDKVWVFWSSSRANTSDLYFEAIAPQLYPNASNQQ